MFLLFELNFGGGTYFQNGHPTGELRQTLLELLPVVVGVSVVDLVLNLFNATSYISFVTSTFDDGGFIFCHNDAARSAKKVKCCVFELESDVFANDLTSGQDSHVLKHCFAAITKARGFNCD